MIVAAIDLDNFVDFPEILIPKGTELKIYKQGTVEGQGFLADEVEVLD